MVSPCHHSCQGGWRVGKGRESKRQVQKRETTGPGHLAQGESLPTLELRAGLEWGLARGASTHHCRMLESIGLEKTGGEVLETVGLGSNPSISRKKCALRGHPSKAVRAGAGTVHPHALQPPAERAQPHSTLALGQLHAQLCPSWPRSAPVAALWEGCCPNRPHFTGTHVEALRSSDLPKLTQQVGGRAWVQSWVWVTPVTKNTEQ